MLSTSSGPCTRCVRAWGELEVDTICRGEVRLSHFNWSIFTRRQLKEGIQTPEFFSLSHSQQQHTMQTPPSSTTSSWPPSSWMTSADSMHSPSPHLLNSPSWPIKRCRPAPFRPSWRRSRSMAEETAETGGPLPPFRPFQTSNGSSWSSPTPTPIRRAVYHFLGRQLKFRR